MGRFSFGPGLDWCSAGGAARATGIRIPELVTMVVSSHAPQSSGNLPGCVRKVRSVSEIFASICPFLAANYLTGSI